ncbi:MAG: IS607 family transposase [Promethearchaeota archaeon]
MNSLFLSIGEVASLLGVCTKTLRRWDKNKLLKADFRTKGNHRRYKKAKIFALFRKQRKVSKVVKCALYGRVSSSRQKKSGDLKRQLESLKEYGLEKGYKIYRSYSDVGSWLNDKRKGLLRLLKDASLGKFDVIVVNYNDRLARFGLQIIKEYFTSWNVRLEVVHPSIIEDSPHAELITDSPQIRNLIKIAKLILIKLTTLSKRRIAQNLKKY